MGGLNSGPGPGITLLIAIVVVLTQTALSAPVHEDEEAQESNPHVLAESHGCYYNFQHYNEGERILTNEPCLNCTCRNRMLMCYLRVCPFTKGIGQNCTVEKVSGQCCPIITCPEVPVQLLTSTTTEHSEGGKAPSHYYGNKGTAVGHLDQNGCNIDGIFYPNGAQVPGSPEKPCELCYCIRNKTACIMQECALHVDGCRPVYEEGQCFPVRYQCDDSPYEEEPTTTIRPAPTPGLIITTTSSEPLECSYNNEIYGDGSRIPTEDPCEHCYCLKGKIACAVQECGAPLEKDGQNCTALPAAPGKCCPDSYQCDNNVIVPAKENWVRKDRKQKFEPKPIEHNDITMTSQGLSSGSAGTTQSGIPSVADAGHPTDGYYPDGATTKKPTTNRFDEESKVTEGATPVKGISEPSVTAEHQQELDKGTQKEKDSRPVKPIGDQKITFPDEHQSVKDITTVSPTEHVDAHVIHMSPEKQPHPEIESHKQGATPQTGANDIYSESSASNAKDPLIDKLHNIIQDVQSQVGDGKTTQTPEEVDIQTTTQSQKGHFTEKPDILSHLPHHSTPGTEITNTTKESSPEDTNIINQIQGIIQGIYSHVTDSIMSTKPPEKTTEAYGQPSVSEKEGELGSHPKGNKHPDSPLGENERPDLPVTSDYPNSVTVHPGLQRPQASNKYPQKPGHNKQPYGTHYQDETAVTGIYEGTTDYPEESYVTQYPEQDSGVLKHPTKYPAQQHHDKDTEDNSYNPQEYDQKRPSGQHPGSVVVTPKPYDPNKHQQGQFTSGISGSPEGVTMPLEEVTTQYPMKFKHPEEYKPGEYTDESKYPQGVTGRPKDPSKHPSEVRPSSEYPEGVESTEQYPDGSKYPERVTGRPKDPSKHPSKYPSGVRPSAEYPEGVESTEQYPDGSKYPEGVTGRPKDPSKHPSKYPSGVRPSAEYPEGVESTEQYPDGSKHPEGVTGRPKDPSKHPSKYPSGVRPSAEYPEGVESTEQYPDGSKHPEAVTGRPKDPIKYPSEVRPSAEYPEGVESTEQYPDGSKHPEGVTGRPKDPTKYPSEVRPSAEYPEGVESTEKYPDGSKYPERVTGRPKDPTKYPSEVRPSAEYPEGVESTEQYPDGSKHPEGVTGKPEGYTKYPGQRTTGKYPTDSKHPEEVTNKPEDSTKHPYDHDSEYTEAVSGRPKDPSKHPDGIRPSGEYPEEVSSTGKYPDGSKYPEGVTVKPDNFTTHPFDNETKYPEGVRGKPKDPIKYPGTPTGEHLNGSEYPEGETGAPGDYTVYPGHRPGVFRPTGKYPTHSEHPEEVTGKPEDSTKYPYEHGTEYPEGVSGRPKDPSKYPSEVRPSGEYPEGAEPTEHYPDRSKYPEGVTGAPGDYSKYPEQRPGGFRPTGKYPTDSKHPEDVSGKPEYSTKYPYEHGTEYPEGVSGKPKDPSDYPEELRPTEQYPDGSKYPEEVTGKPHDYTMYPAQPTGGFKPTGNYPTHSTHSETVTGKPDYSTKYPYDHGTEYPEGVSGRPKDPSQYTDRVRPTGEYTEGIEPTEQYPDGSKYPEGVTGQPGDYNKYPGQLPSGVRPTGKYPTDSKHPEEVTDKPEDSTKYSYDHGTEYPEGVSGRPKDPSKYPSEVRPSGEYPEGAEPTEQYPDGSKYPEGVIGQPGDYSKYPGQKPDRFRPTGKYPTDSKHPEEVTGKPEYFTTNPHVHATEYPEGGSGRPKDPSKYPEGVESTGKYPDGSKYPERVTGKPEDYTKYPGQRPTGKYPTDSKHPEDVSGKPEYSTKYPYEHGTEYPEGVSGRPKDPSKYPSEVRPSGEYPEGAELTEQYPDASKYPEGVTGAHGDYGKYPEQKPGGLRPTGTYPTDSKHPEDVSGIPEYSTKYPYDHGTEYPEDVSGRPKDPSKYPEGMESTENYPDGSKYPERITGTPGDDIKYPGQRPDAFQPTGVYLEGVSGKPKDPSTYPHGSQSSNGYPDVSEHFVGATDKPEATTYYPEGVEVHETEHSGLSVRPKDPSKYPGTGSSEVTIRPDNKSKYPDVLPSGQKPTDKYFSKPESETEYPFVGADGKPESENKLPGGVRPPQYSPGSVRPVGITAVSESSTEKVEKFRPTEDFSEWVTGRPEYHTIYPDVAKPDQHPGGQAPYASKPVGENDSSKKPENAEPPTQIPNESFNKHPEGITGAPEFTDQYPTDSKHPNKSKPSDDSDYPDKQYHTNYPFDSEKPEKPDDKFSGTVPQDYTGKPAGGKDETSTHPHGLKPQPTHTASDKPEGSKHPYSTEYPEMVTGNLGVENAQEVDGKPHASGEYPVDSMSTEYPKHSKPDRPHITPGVQDKPSGTDYSETTDDEYETEYGTEYPESATKYPMGSKYSTKPPGTGNKNQQKPSVENETGNLKGSTSLPESNSYPAVSKRPEISPEGALTSATDLPEGLKPSSSGHYPSGPSSTGVPFGKPVDDSYSSKLPETDLDTERPHYTSKYPEKPNAEDQLLGTEQPGIKVTSHSVDYGHPTENSSKSPYYTTKRPLRPSQSEESKETTKGTPYATENPKGTITDKYPDGSKLPDKTGVQIQEVSTGHYSQGTDKPSEQYPATKYSEHVTGQPEYLPSFKPEQSPTKTANTTKESSHDDSANILNQIQGIIQGIYSQVTDSIMSTIKPESTTEIDQSGKPQEGDHYLHSGQTGVDQPSDTQIPDGMKHPKDPQEVTIKPQIPSKHPEGVEEHPDKFRPTIILGSSKYPDPIGQPGKPEGSTESTDGTEAYGTEYPGVSGKPKEPTKYSEGVKPGQHPEESGPTEQYPDDSKRPDSVTGRPEHQTKFPEEVSGLNATSSKHPQGFKPGKHPEDSEYPEEVRPTEKYPIKDKQPDKIKPLEKHTENPEYQTEKPGGENLSGMQNNNAYFSSTPVARPTQPGYTNKPDQVNKGTEFPDEVTQTGEYPDGSKYPETITAKPKDPNEYHDAVQPNEENPEGVRPTIKYPGGSKYPEGVTGKPDYSTKYPYDHGTEYPEGVSGRPKDPSQYTDRVRPTGEYTEGIEPTEQYPDGSKYPEGVTGQPGDYNKYPGQLPSGVRPTGKYPTDSKHPEEVTDKPEDSTKYSYDHGTEYPEGVSGRPKDPSKYPSEVRPSGEYPEGAEPTEQYPDGSKYPEGVIGQPGDYSKYPGQKPDRFRPTGKYPTDSKHPEEVTGKPEYFTTNPHVHATEYPEGGSGRPKDPSKYPEGVESTGKYPDGSKYPERVTGKPEDYTKYPGQRPTGKYPTDSKHPEDVSGKPEYSTKYPYEHGTEYPEGVSGRPKDPSKYPSEVRPSGEYPEGAEPTEQYPDASKYPEGVTGAHGDYGKYPEQKPGGLRPTGTYPTDSKHPEDVSGIPEYSTKYPYDHGTEYPEGVSGRPKDPIKYPGEVRPTADYPPEVESTEQYPDGSKYPERVTGKPEVYTQYPGQRPTGNYPTDSKHPEDVSGKPEYSTKYPYEHGIEHPEGVSGRPKDPNKYPSEVRPNGEYPEEISSTGKYPDGSKFPEGVTGQPVNYNKYPGQRPGGVYPIEVRPSGEHPDGSKYTDGVTGKPDGSTNYPGDHATEYPEGVTGKPKDPSKHPYGVRPTGDYPEEVKPTEEYPDRSKYPEENTGKPDDYNQYPGEKPDRFRPTVKYPTHSEFPEEVTGKPEDSTKYPYEYGTEYPEGVSGRPKDPSKYPSEVRPSGEYPEGAEPTEQYPEGSKYPEGVIGQPGDYNKYPGQKPDRFRPTGKYPTDSKHPEEVTGKPEDSTKYPYEYGTEYPEGVSGRPKDPSKYPSEVRPSGEYPEGAEPTEQYPEGSKYPEGVIGQPGDYNKYPGQKPDRFRPTGKYPTDSKHPEEVTGKPEYFTKYPYDRSTEYPEGVSGRPKDPSNYPEGVESTEKYPDGSKYPERVTGKPEDYTKYPEQRPSGKYPTDSKHPEDVSGKPEYSTKYPYEHGSEYPEGVSGKPKDPSQYTDGVRPSGEYPEEVIGQPGDYNKYPGQNPDRFRPTGKYPTDSKHPEGVTGKPEYFTTYPHVHATEYPEGVSGRPKDPSKYPEGVESTEKYPDGSKYPEGVTGKPADVGDHPVIHDSLSPDHSDSKNPEDSKPLAQYPDGEKPFDGYIVTSKPESATNYPEGDSYVTEYPGLSSKPKEPTKYPGVVKPEKHPEGFTDQYPSVTKKPQYVTKHPEDGTGVTHVSLGSKHPSVPDDHITYPGDSKPSEQLPFNEQSGVISTEVYLDKVTDQPYENTKYPLGTGRPENHSNIYPDKPGGYYGSKYPTRPDGTSDSTVNSEVTNKYPDEASGTKYPEDTNWTGQVGSKYPEGTTGKSTKRPGYKPSTELEYTTILPEDFEATSEPDIGVSSPVEYPNRLKPEQPSEAVAVSTFEPIHKYPVKHSQRPDGLSDESSGTEYPETTEHDYEYETERPSVTGTYPDGSKPGESRPTKPGTEYLPHEGEKPNLHTHGLDENSIPSEQTYTDRTPVTDSEQKKPSDGTKPSSVDDYPSRPRPNVPGEGLNNEDLTSKPSEQSTSGPGLHPTVELTPDVKIPEGDLVTGQPEKQPSSEQPSVILSTKPVDGSAGHPFGGIRQPQTTPDDDLINKLHNIISGIQSQTNIPSEQSTASPQIVDEFGRPILTDPTKTHTTMKESYVTEKPQKVAEFDSNKEGTIYTDSSKPLPGRPSEGLTTDNSQLPFENYPESTESDKTVPHFLTEDTLHTVTPQDGAQKQTPTDKPLHVVYPTYYPDGVVTRKPSAQPNDGDKKVTVTPQSTHEKAPEKGETQTVYDVQTEISSETATTPGFVIVEEVHTEIHSERPTGRPIFGPAITQPISPALTTHSGYQTESPETTKPSYVTVTPIGTISESDNIMHLYSPKDKHPATGIPTTQIFTTESAVQQHTRFPSRKTTQKPFDDLITHKSQGASYVPYKLVNSTKVYYPEKELPQKPSESGSYDGYDHIPYTLINGTKFFYPDRVATEEATTSATLGMYVPYKIINGTKVYYTQDPPQEPEKYDGLDYVPFDIVNGTKVFYPEKVSTTPAPTNAMYVPFKIVKGNKVYFPKDAKDEPQDVPDEYDGFDYVPFDMVNGKKIFHPERIPNHTPSGSEYVPYKLVNNHKVYYPKDAQKENEDIPEGYDGFDFVPYDIIDNEKVYYPEKISPQKESAMFVPYKLVNGTKVYYPKQAQDKPSQTPEDFDGFDYIPYDMVNGTKVFHPEKITSEPEQYPKKMFVPYKIVNNTKVFYPKDAQNKPRPLKPGYDGLEYLPYDEVNGTKVFHPPAAVMPGMYVPYTVKNGEKVYDVKKATEFPQDIPEGYEGVDHLPYEIKDGNKVFYPERVTTPASKEGALYVPYKIVEGKKVYYPNDAASKPVNIPGWYDGFNYVPYEVQNGKKIFYHDRVATPITEKAPQSTLCVPYKLIKGKKVYQTDKATENPQDIPDEFDGFDYVPYEMINGEKIFYPERVKPTPKEGAMYVPYRLLNGNKIYHAARATDNVEDIPKGYDGSDYLPYKIHGKNKIFYPDKIVTTTPTSPKKGMYVPYKLINGKKVYQTDKATENPQETPEEFDGFDYVPYDIKNGQKIFYPERVIPTPKEGAMYVPYKLNNGTKVYYADKATEKLEDIPKGYDGFDYIPYENQNGNKLFYPDRIATPTNEKAMYVPYTLDNGKKVYHTDKATDNPQGLPEKFDGFDYVPYDTENGNKVFYSEKGMPAKGSQYVPYKIVKGMKVYHPEDAADTTQEIPEEFDGFDYLPFETQNRNKIFYPDRVTQAPKGAIYLPYKLENGRKVYNPNKATNNPQDIPKGYDGCDYIPYEIKNGNKIFHPEQITEPTPTQGSMYVPYKLINGTKVYYADKATDKQEDVPKEYDGFDYLPYELQNGNKIFYPDKASTPHSRPFKYIPYKLVGGRKVYYPDRAADKPEDIPKGYDGFDYLPIEYVTKPQNSQGMFVPYKVINGTKVYYPQEAHKRPQPLSDEYSGLDYMPFETVNGTKVFYPEREPQAMYVPYKIMNGNKVFYPKDAQRNPEDIPAGYDGLDYVPYDVINGSQIFHPDRVPEYQGMFVPYKIVNGKKVFYPKFAQHKPMVIDGYDGFDYLPYENMNGTKVFKPEVPEQAMYVPYKIINGTKVYYPKHAQRKPETPTGYDGSDYIPYQLVNGTKIFDPSIKAAMYVPYKVLNGTKVYYPKHAQHKPEHIPSGYDGHDYLPYDVINGNKVFRPEKVTSQIKQAMYVPYKMVNGTKVYYPKHAQNKPEYIPEDYDGHDYLPYEIVNGNKVFKPEQASPQIKQAMYVPYKIVNGTKVYHPKHAQHNPYLIPAGYDGFDYIPFDVVNGNKVFYPEQATSAPSSAKQAMYVPYKIVNGTKAYYPKHAQNSPSPVPSNYDGLDYLPYEVVNGTKIFAPQPHTKPTYLQGMFVPYKLSNNTKIFYPKDAHNKPHYVPQGYDGADYVPYEPVNNTKLFYPELISMAQPSTTNIPGVYVPFKLVNNKKVFYPKEATPFPPTVRYPYDGVAFVPYKSSVPSEIIYVDEDDLTKPHTPSGQVPGEGSCYLNNKTYANNTEIAPVSPCQAKCTCISSVVRCVRVKCPPPPQNKVDCSPVYREGTCCPTYTCGDSEYDYPTTVGYSETKAPEGTLHGHDSESTTAFTDLTSQKRKPGSEEGKPEQQSEEYHLHKPPKPSNHESLEPYDNVEGHLTPEEDYDAEDEEPYGPGTCRYAGKVYVSAQQIPRDDPCDFCFCFRSDIICLQQSCPPPIPGCRDEPIEGFCCPRYECHVKMATLLNVTSTTTTTTTTLPPHFFPHAYKGSATRTGCFVQGKAYRVGQPIPSASGPCMDCICGGNGRMKCEPKVCTPEPMIRKMISPSENTTTSTNER